MASVRVFLEYVAIFPIDGVFYGIDLLEARLLEDFLADYRYLLTARIYYLD